MWDQMIQQFIKKLFENPSIRKIITDVDPNNLRAINCYIEQLLMTQAKTLDFFFYQMLGRLANTQNIKQIQAYTEVALKSQNQSRKALSVLADLKHPRRTTFIKQQNNAINQQVNNTAKPQTTKKRKKFSNELIAEVSHGAEKMDIGTAIEAIPSNISPKTMGTSNG